MTDAKGTRLNVGDEVSVPARVMEIREDGSVYMKAFHGELFFSLLPTGVVKIEPRVPPKPAVVTPTPAK